jgi:tRNA-2-methylthio-N6-dimethylallyladenosine synthase
MRRYFFITFGCQMNVHDSEVLQGILSLNGFSPASSEEDADIILLNTCSVREKAVDKVFAKLGRLADLKRAKPDLILGVVGCTAQQLGEEVIKRAPYVGLVLGSNKEFEIADFIPRVAQGEKVVDIALDSSYPDHPISCTRRRSTFQAYVTISRGCSNFCSYCIVPHVRGEERSRPVSGIMSEIKELAEKGYKEVTLLGQNVNSYRDLEDEEIDFVRLLHMVHQVNGIDWIRFITSHPRDFSWDLARSMGELPKVCPCLHLPIQSGSSRILALMNRGYTKEDYLERISWAKEWVPDIALTGDIIVGFPGEEEEDFAETMDLVEKIRFDVIFSFKYSPRPFTKAAKLPDSVPPEVKTARIVTLQNRQREIQLARNEELVGKEAPVLVDGVSKRDEEAVSGRTGGNKVVNFKGGKKLIGRFVRVKITRACPNSLYGEKLK